MIAPHHAAWLSAHPDRDAAWLRRMVDEGFHVHHVDSNRANNDPANLVLIEGADHMRMHGKPLFTKADRTKKKAEREAELLALAPQAYSLLATAGYGTAIARLGINHAKAYALAKDHAKTNGLPWPVQNGRGPKFRHTGAACKIDSGDTTFI